MKYSVSHRNTLPRCYFALSGPRTTGSDSAPKQGLRVLQTGLIGDVKGLDKRH
jgi:hypothetical protein